MGVGQKVRSQATKTEGHIRERYLELPHLLELESEFNHVPPHVKQTHVDG